MDLRALWRRLDVSAALAAVAMLAIGFAPLFDGPGYESSLAAGIVVPPIVAIDVAFRRVSTSIAPVASLALGLRRGLLLGAIAYATTILHGLRAGFCSLGGGSLLFLLGPFAGCLVAGVWGAIAGALAARATTRRKRLVAAFFLALAGPLASVLASGVRFFTSPMVFAFDPFVGFFSGTLYDTVIDGTDRLLTYRVGSVATVLAAFGIARHLERRHGSAWLTAGTAAAIIASIAITFAGSRLGHWQTPSTIRRELGGFRHSRLCDVVYASATKDEDAALFARDCDADVEQVAAWLGIAPFRVTAYLFPNAAEKRRLMGAAEVYIAKPWREEVYVQVDGYPHPVLGHEIAHVLAGSFGEGPFRIAGRLGGLVPNPGLVEGLATAASPEDDELSPEAWTRAMLELGILPRVESIFSIEFLFHDAARAYTIAGAFVGWIHERFGAEAVRRWYGGEPLANVTGKSFAELEEAFRAYVKTLPIPDRALAIAKARFGRPAIFARRCPHEVDAKKRDANQALGGGDVRRATRETDELLREGVRDGQTLLLRATCDERLGDVVHAEDRLRAIAADESLPITTRDRAEERLGDVALVAGRLDEAATHYQTALDRTLDEDRLRTLDVKLVATKDDIARPALTWLLAGTPKEGVDIVRAAEELGRWVEKAPDDGLPRYLLARNAAARSLWPRAVELFSAALDRTISLPRVRREAARQLVIAGCATKREDAVKRGLDAWSAAGPLPGNRDALLRALASRCLRE